MNQHKELRMFGCSFSALVVLFLFTYLLAGRIPVTEAVIFGGLLMLCAIPLHIAGKYWLPAYAIGITVNMLGSAFYISAYYTSVGATATFSALFLSGLAPLLYLVVLHLFVYLFPNNHKAFCVLGTLLTLLGILVYVVLWIVTGRESCSFGFFSMVICFTMTLALSYTLHKDGPWVLRYASFAGFGYFSLIAIVALAILSEGGLLEDLDLKIDWNRRKKS